MPRTKLKILIGVPSLLADNKKMLKTIGAYYTLKAEFKSSVVINYASRMNELAALCHCSRRTMHTRISEFKKAGLASTSAGRLNLVSYEKMHAIIEVVEHKNKYHYKPITTKPEYILRATAIKENLDRQTACVLGKIEKYTKGLGLSFAQKEQKREADLKRLIVAFKNSAPLQRDDTEDILYNPDVAISQDLLAFIYGLKSQASGYYWQQVLQKNKLISVEQRLIESNVRKRKSSLGKVFYSRKTQKTYCQMPNKILFVAPNLQKVD